MSPMTPFDQAGFMQAINVAITKALLMPDSNADAMAAALGQSVGALAVIARHDVDVGTILARVHAEALKVIEKFSEQTTKDDGHLHRLTDTHIAR